MIKWQINKYIYIYNKYSHIGNTGFPNYRTDRFYSSLYAVQKLS